MMRERLVRALEQRLLRCRLFVRFLFLVSAQAKKTECARRKRIDMMRSIRIPLGLVNRMFLGSFRRLFCREGHNFGWFRFRSFFFDQPLVDECFLDKLFVNGHCQAGLRNRLVSGVRLCVSEGALGFAVHLSRRFRFAMP